ncbi:MAG: D-alanine--D-alanine ligase [Cardiobacteriaceae bacterium]|nr:D-alanine--D-alanine ligase [Cardiobacteriaceae bacterium]
MMKKFGKVTVLYGGDSAEREVSLLSGQAVFAALAQSGVDAHLVDTRERERVLALKSEGYDRAFVMLHGRGGEDGQMQAILDWQGIPYTGSGVLACALAMDKVLTKKLWQACGLPVKKDVVIEPGMDYARLARELDAARLAIKPALEGSSVGVSAVENEAEFQQAIVKAGGYGEKIMAEPWVLGRELTYAIVGDLSLPGIEIAASDAHLFYDYDAKYLAEDTRYLCPPPIAETLEDDLRKLAREAFAVLGGRGWGRVDMMLDTDNRPWLLEVNMAPGMTSHSLVPMAAKTAGWSFDKLVLFILQETLG